MEMHIEYAERLKWLIRYLESERAIRSDSAALASVSVDGLWNRFRGLVNTREPVLASSEFYTTQDSVLRSIISAAGIVQTQELSRCLGDKRVSVWRGDITTIAADAIVNAANSKMLGCWVPGHACIDNAIHTFAGVQLREECARIMREQGCDEPTAQAKVTAAYNLPARWIIHTVGPIAEGEPSELQRRELAQSYIACLDAALDLGCASIVFCCISTGVFGFPKRQAAIIATRSVRDWLDSHETSSMHVVFDVFDSGNERLYQGLLGS